MPSAMLTPPEVAQQIGIDAEKVRTWIATGELRAVNIAERVSGRPRWRIRPDDLEAFLESRTAAPAAPARRRRHPKPKHVIQFF